MSALDGIAETPRFDMAATLSLLFANRAVTALTAGLWYWYPAWVPRRLPRFGRPRLPKLRLEPSCPA